MDEEEWLGVVHALLELCYALEDAASSCREVLERFGRWTWNPAKIKWVAAEGFKGPYERSEDVNSYDFKWLVRDLAEHDGRLWRGGYFYWLFRNGATVGRKKMGRSGE